MNKFQLAVGFALLAIAASHFPDELLDDISASRPCKITPCKSICETSTTPFAPIRMHTPFGPIKINDPSRVCRPDHTCYLRNIECIKMIAKQESRARASKPRAPRKVPGQAAKSKKSPLRIPTASFKRRATATDTCKDKETTDAKTGRRISCSEKAKYCTHPYIRDRMCPKTCDACPVLTRAPTHVPTIAPTSRPTYLPTLVPTEGPTADPTRRPTALPTPSPTHRPTDIPSTLSPTTDEPSFVPTDTPTHFPTLVPSATPTVEPTTLPTAVPTEVPTEVPSHLPSLTATVSPTATVPPTVKLLSPKADESSHCKPRSSFSTRSPASPLAIQYYTADGSLIHTSHSGSMSVPASFFDQWGQRRRRKPAAATPVPTPKPSARPTNIPTDVLGGWKSCSGACFLSTPSKSDCCFVEFQACLDSSTNKTVTCGCWKEYMECRNCAKRYECQAAEVARDRDVQGFSTKDVGRTVEIKGGKVSLNGFDRIVSWIRTKPVDYKGKIVSVGKSKKRGEGGKAQLEDRTELPPYRSFEWRNTNYKKAKDKLFKKIKEQPTLLKPRPKVGGAKFAQLAVGSCFMALREEIHTHDDCVKGAEFLNISTSVESINTDNTEDESLKPSRCYIDMATQKVVFNARESAHDAEAGKYKKICGRFIEAAEIGSAVQYRPSGSELRMDKRSYYFFEADVKELNIKLNTSYWFIKRDGSRQRGPYRFTQAPGYVTYVGQDSFGFRHDGGWGPENTGEDQLALCMAVSPQIKIKPFMLPAKQDPWSKTTWCKHADTKKECRDESYPQMEPTDFLLLKPLVHGKACKPPRGWKAWELNETMMTMKADFDGDGVLDYAWCLRVENTTRCSTKLRGTKQSYNGCSVEQNTPWILMNAPQLFASPGDCVCSCNSPRCYGGKYDSMEQAISVVKDGLSDKVRCAMSLQGRAQLKQCCKAKIDRFKVAVKERCKVKDTENWCKGVPDGMEVQIGGRSSSDPHYWNHQSTNACAAVGWRQINNMQLWTNKVAYKDLNFQSTTAGKQTAVLGLAKDSSSTGLEDVELDEAISGSQEVDLALDDAASGKQEMRAAWADGTPAPVDGASGWLTPTPTAPPVLKKTQAGYDNQCME